MSTANSSTTDNTQDDKQYISYNNVHQLCQVSAERIKKFKPDIIIAIGGGGFIPARILRTFLKEPGIPTIRIFAIILSLYEDLNSVGSNAEHLGVQVKRIQWIDYEQCKLSLLGKKILIVDEVDDTRTTLCYALQELEKDVREQSLEKGIKYEESGTKFGIFVLHDKLKPKKAELPDYILKGENRYICAKQVPNKWYAYPWESTDIVYHTRMAMKQGNDVFLPEGEYERVNSKTSSQ
ncbi:hypoxanthine phosphoribosyltransferase SCDLUD_003270 [Saccharomycodes ludwigii]|uniref:hypoxanthine phosphoribosyltransferase n=1 Tax=Saccharomycodes ludwigii TaxID=36035 RepID=UPI001E82A894|nr:hypothetical protein SCDLUD_003270 [Saccharomycodes ludwigii]KAH3900298.1 hypothetical protein SCDLUD_003270 [Saccharomycodes ludwigii]